MNTIQYQVRLGQARPEDAERMALAVQEAKKAWRLSPPNPSVGAVIFKDGRLIGRGFTQRAGGPHAEIMAMRDADARGESLEGAEVYVTLEPCSHYGRTPPCALALIERKVKRVVAAILDPNPLVAGRGLRMLEEAGIEVVSGVMAEEAREVNIGFLTRMTRGTPWVRMKWAQTLDGRTALPDGRSKWITGEQARMDGQYWRGRAGAVLTGIGTVLADDPQMNVRLPDQARQPLRVVLDPRLEMPLEAKLLRSEGGAVLIAAGAACGASPDEKVKQLEAAGAQVIRLPAPNDPGHVDLQALLIELARREVNELHVEAGERLNGAFLDAGLVDELLVYVAPCLFGAGMAPAAAAAPASPGQARRWQVREVKTIGADVRMIFWR